jgi:hypothetical protein
VTILPAGTKTAEATVVGSVQRTLADRTARISMTMKVVSSATSFGGTGSGAVDFTHNAGRIEVGIDKGASGMTMTVLYMGGTIYENVPELSGLLPGKSWVSIDLSSLVDATAGEPGIVGSDDNPVAMLKLYAEQGNTVSRLGRSTINGIAVDGYSVTVNPAAVSRSLARAKLPAWIRQMMASVDLQKVTSDLYIDNSGSLRRYSIQMRLTVAAGQTATLNEVVDLSDFGAPVEIAVPPSGQVASFQQFLQAVKAGSPQQGAPTPGSQTSSCITAIPPGVSPQAADYLRAANADYPAWEQVTHLITANGDKWDPQIAELEYRVDTQFLQQLRAIPFNGSAVQQAQMLETDLSRYLADLTLASKNQVDQAVQSEMSAIDSERAAASAGLRGLLGVQPASCSVRRP